MTPPRLWEAVVSVEVTIIVVAGDEELAKAKAEEVAWEVIEDQQFSSGADTYVSREITKHSGLPAGWAEHCIPWGAEGDMTIADHRIAAEMRGPDDPIPDCPGQALMFPDAEEATQ